MSPGLDSEEEDILAEELEMADANGHRFYAKLQHKSSGNCVCLYSPFWVVNETEFSIKLALNDPVSQELAGQVCAGEKGAAVGGGGQTPAIGLAR